MGRAGTPFEAAFRARGRRITPQRALLFHLIDELKHEHPSAESLYVRAARAMPSISLRTVYAILKDLEAMHAIRHLDLGTGSMRYCANPVRHHHIVCIKCGKTKDVELDLGPVEIPQNQREGFVVINYEVVFRGVCAACRS